MGLRKNLQIKLERVVTNGEAVRNQTAKNSPSNVKVTVAYHTELIVAPEGSEVFIQDIDDIGVHRCRILKIGKGGWEKEYMVDDTGRCNLCEYIEGRG